MKAMKKRLFTWANFWTVVSLACGTIAYYKCGETFGDISMATGTLAFFVGIA